MKRVNFILMGMVVVVSLGVVQVLWLRQRAERSRADWQQRAATLKLRVGAVDRTLAGLFEERMQLEKKNKETAAADKPVATGKTATEKSRTQIDREAQEKDPKVQLATLSYKRVKLARNYGPYFKRNGITVEQQNKLLDTMAKEQETLQDLQAIKGADGLRDSATAIDTLRKQAASERELAEKEILGDVSYTALREYERSVAVQEWVNGFAGRAAMAGLPLDLDQAEAMTKSLASLSDTYQNGGEAPLSSIDWNHAAMQLDNVLSSEQLKYYRKIISHISPRGFTALQNAILADGEKARAALR